MNISDKGLALIKSYEKCRLAAFKPTPNDVFTIGWGRTLGVKQGDACTQEQADQWLLEDVSSSERCVTKAVTVPMTQGEFDALVSLCYNIGCAAFSGSTLLKLLNASDFDGASGQFSRWNKQAGHELDGLTKRRAAEVDLFETTIV